MSGRVILKGGAALLLLLSFCILGAEVVIDGSISPGEYAMERELDKGKVYWAVRDGKMAMAYDAPTEGWVALGFGGRRMDGLLMVLGYVENGEPEFTVDRGRGHRHAPIEEEIDITVSLQESRGSTVLEILIPLSAFPGNGAGGSDHTFGFGKKDDFRSYHSFRGADSFPH